MVQSRTGTSALHVGRELNFNKDTSRCGPQSNKKKHMLRAKIQHKRPHITYSHFTKYPEYANLQRYKINKFFLGLQNLEKIRNDCYRIFISLMRWQKCSRIDYNDGFIILNNKTTESTLSINIIVYKLCALIMILSIEELTS